MTGEMADILNPADPCLQQLKTENWGLTTGKLWSISPASMGLLDRNYQIIIRIVEKVQIWFVARREFSEDGSDEALWRMGTREPMTWRWSTGCGEIGAGKGRGRGVGFAMGRSWFGGMESALATSLSRFDRALRAGCPIQARRWLEWESSPAAPHLDFET